LNFSTFFTLKYHKFLIAALLVGYGFPFSVAWGGGFEGPGLGARATAMGGAFIGVADDWTAIYWNPAGLSQLQGTGFDGTFEYLHANAHDSSGLANPVPPLSPANILRGDAFVQLGGEPSRFNATDSHFGTPLPALGFYTHWRNVTFAGGSYTPLGFSLDVTNASPAGYNESFKSLGYIINHNLSLASEIIPGLRLGAGVNLVQAHIERSADKAAPDEDLSSSAAANAWGVQGLFGILLNAGHRWRLGAVYRTGQDLHLKGNFSVSDSLFPLTIPGLGTFHNESTGFTQVLRNPTTYGVGLSYLPWDSVTLAGDWQRTAWSPTRVSIQYDQQDALLQNQNLDAGWTSTSRYRFGAEWRPLKAWSFRAGYFRDPRAVSFDSEALTQLIDADLHYYTAGLSFTHGRWRWSFAEQYAVGSEQLGDRSLSKEATSTALEVEYALRP
jgi:long-chain fatty acid transport protein